MKEAELSNLIHHLVKPGGVLLCSGVAVATNLSVHPDKPDGADENVGKDEVCNLSQQGLTLNDVFTSNRDFVETGCKPVLRFA